MNMQDSVKLTDSLALPGGAVLKNRMVKSAMSDSLGDGRGRPVTEQVRLYERWAEGGIALSIIGEVQVDPGYPEKPGNLVLSEAADFEGLRQLTQRARANGTHIWPQLGHAGALAHADASQPAGPSALDLPGLQCRAMTLEEIRALPGKYASAAQRAQEAGFTGVQIHAGHGFLLSQFLSPLFNQRDDEYGGSVENRIRLILDIIIAVRAAVGAGFPVAIKINTSDMLEGGLTEQDALKIVALLDSTSLDLIELSGGTYFPGAKSCSDSSVKQGAYFEAFAARAQQLTDIPLMVTGGIKNRRQAAELLSSGKADLVGLARAMVLEPQLPLLWSKDSDTGELVFPRFATNPPGGVTAWYTLRLTALAKDSEADFDMPLEEAIDVYEARDKLRSAEWRQWFNTLSV